MKIFLKKINRGLILGAILIIIVAIYVIVDYSRFSSEKTIIKSNFEEYNKNFTEALIMEDLNYSKESDTYNNLSNIINKYWCDKKITKDAWTITYPRIFQELDDKFSDSKISEDINNKDLHYDNGYILDINYNVKEITIKKAGQNLANVTGTIVYEIYSSDPGYFILPFSTIYTYDYYGYEDTNNQSIPTGKCLVTEVEDEFNVYMYREDGTWKIAESAGFSHTQYLELKDWEVK